MATVEVRDAVHGLIPFSDQVWGVVDTPAYQRLRGVQQLAFTHLVYPGARHSRFEHCLGAAHIAGSLAARAQASDTERQRIQLAALVHDIGHGPFSHVSEEVFEQLTGRRAIHESISAAIIQYDPFVRQALGDETATWIAELLTYTGHARHRGFARDVVSGPADIDKLDYLLRDSHYCGVNYGRYDLPKVIEAARRFDDPLANETYLAFHEDAVFALEEMLLARYHMHRQVYGHKTRVGIDQMLVRAMLLGIEEDLLPRSVFAPPESPNEDFVRDYLRFDDAEVIKTLCRSNGRAGDVMQALMERRLCKQVIPLNDEVVLARLGRIVGGAALKPEEQALESLLPEAEARIAAVAGVDPVWVILHWDERRSPLTSQYSPRTQSSDIFLVNDKGDTTLFHDRSEVFQRGDVGAKPSVSLYLRPQDDLGLEERVDRLRNAVFEELDRIGRASNEV